MAHVPVYTRIADVPEELFAFMKYDHEFDVSACRIALGTSGVKNKEVDKEAGKEASKNTEAAKVSGKGTKQAKGKKETKTSAKKMPVIRTENTEVPFYEFESHLGIIDFKKRSYSQFYTEEQIEVHSSAHAMPETICAV